MPYVESKTTIKGDGAKIYDIIKDMAAYPNFMHDLVSNVDGRKIVWTERDTFYPEELKITYAQTEGDLKRMEGSWLITPQADGCEVTLAVDFEFGIPMIAGLLNPILKKKVRENSENMLNSIKAQIEK